MKKILIIHSNMELGGAETSLLGLLQSMDYTKYAVDLLLFEQKGELLPLIPKQVRLMPINKKYQCLTLPIKDVLVRMHSLGITAARLLGKIRGKSSPDKTYATKLFAHYYAMPFLPNIPGEYDIAISFIDPHYIVAKKVKAKVTLGWLHTDFSRVHVNPKYDKKMWDALDYIVNISESCKEKFVDSYPELQDKAIVIENILSKSFIEQRSFELDTVSEMDTKAINVLSIGRFSEQKNFDNVPDICKRIRMLGKNVKWYLIGYGDAEELIRQKIVECKMEEHVIILGKKDNPYPYIKACDLYVQPSRYEGKCVAVREAQMLGKPVVITKYATSASQLQNSKDGLIVPMDNKGCAEKIVELLNNQQLLEKISFNCLQRDYSNAIEIETLYRIIDEVCVE